MSPARAKSAKTRARSPSGPKHYSVRPQHDGPLYLYGLHSVRHALENAERDKIALWATQNALARLELARLDMPPEILADLPVHQASPRQLDQMVGRDAVHQGCVLETHPLKPKSLEQLADTAHLVLVLDQITDPHNVGAIMRSAVAMGAGALITTSRHSPSQTGVLAKSASGALDLIDHIEIRNLAKTLVELSDLGFVSLGLDSEGDADLEHSIKGDKIALVLGAEGKGLRQKTRENCQALARIDLPGKIKSLNVSNAAALALYVVQKALSA